MSFLSNFIHDFSKTILVFVFVTPLVSPEFIQSYIKRRLPVEILLCKRLRLHFLFKLFNWLPEIAFELIYDFFPLSRLHQVQVFRCNYLSFVFFLQKPHP